MKTISRRLVALCSFTLLVGCDHATKYAAKTELSGDQPRQLIRGVLELRYAENTDTAFNLLRWIPEGTRAPILVVVGAAAVLALGIVFLRRPPATRLGRLALLLVAAGALGNYVDRLVRGYVVDFIHLSHWPVFNMADVYVTAGVGILGALTVFFRTHNPET